VPLFDLPAFLVSSSMQSMKARAAHGALDPQMVAKFGLPSPTMSEYALTSAYPPRWQARRAWGRPPLWKVRQSA
jgi:hypothetical protein